MYTFSSRSLGWAFLASLCLLPIAACNDKQGQAQVDAAPRPEDTQAQAKPQPVVPAIEAHKLNADEELAASVKKALRAAAEQVGEGIDVSAAGGPVQLWGTAASRAARRKAADITMATPGVASVDNRIVVLKGS